jgi:hypothetical protein
MRTGTRPATLLVLVTAALLVLAASASSALAASSPATVTVKAAGDGAAVAKAYGAGAASAIKANLRAFWRAAEADGVSRTELRAWARADASSPPAAERRQLRVIARAAGVRYIDLLAFNLYAVGGGRDKPQLAGACTEFAATGDGSATGDVIAHKNRDLTGVQVLMFVTPDEGYAYTALMTAGAAGVSQGINEMGVTTGHTWVPVSKYAEGYSPFVLNQMILEQCADLDEAVTLIDEAPKHEGATFLVSDADGAAFIETVSSAYETDGDVPSDTLVDPVVDEVAWHTNHYVLEPFYSMVLDGELGYMWTPSYARYDRAAALTAEKGGVVSPVDVIAFSRDLENFGNSNPNKDVIAMHPEVPRSVWGNGWPGFSICNARTVSATVFVSDAEHPELLSTMWMAINNPCFSPYVPIHTGVLSEAEYCAETLAPYLDRSAWNLATELRDSEAYEWGELLPVFEPWEADVMTRTADNEDVAMGMSPGERGAYLATEDCEIALEALDLLESLMP